jgi:hypothetical protein
VLDIWLILWYYKIRKREDPKTKQKEKQIMATYFDWEIMGDAWDEVRAELEGE